MCTTNVNKLVFLLLICLLLEGSAPSINLWGPRRNFISFSTTEVIHINKLSLSWSQCKADSPGLDAVLVEASAHLVLGAPLHLIVLHVVHYLAFTKNTQYFSASVLTTNEMLILSPSQISIHCSHSLNPVTLPSHVTFLMRPCGLYWLLL